MTFVRACSRSEVPPGTVKFVAVDGKDLVISNVDGKFYAMENWCTHEQGNLSEGQLEGNVLTCPDHGAQFDVKTGKVLGGPDGEPADSISPEKFYRVEVEGDDVTVDIT
jgi:3-phenylpropionate/trans-cinnamate dioxygenase ferredoxin subunit